MLNKLNEPLTDEELAYVLTLLVKHSEDSRLTAHICMKLMWQKRDTLSQTS